MAKKKNNNLLRLNINFEGLKLEVVSDDPNKTLAELTNLINSKKALLESMIPPDNLDMYDLVDDESGVEFNTRKFTKELLQNKDYMESVKTLYFKHKSFLYRKEMIDAKQEIDLTNKRLNLIIEKADINTLIRKLVYNINHSKLKHVFVHIITDNFTKEHKMMFLDELRKKSSFVDATVLFTPKKLNGVVVAETLFFGDFPQNNDEE